MAAKKTVENWKMNVHFFDEETRTMLRIVLACEAALRGLTIGQACYEMLMEAVDIDSYPPELKERLQLLAEESSRLAMEDALRVSGSAN